MKKFLPITASSLLLALSLSSCETSGQSAIAGAATGAAIGGLLHGRGSDAMAGAAIGAGAGYLLGKVVREDRHDRYYEEERDSDRYERHEPAPRRSAYPLAQRTNRVGFVISPYPPFNRIDVRGIPHGAKVIDPSADRLFINP